ncbi:hypothetical protein, variant [Aphanomyces invadans]|nr:hypothetical protein, variant [Aphanomyces invadans]ETW04156.1 hypothetical protein, variant [Aphanomyces invadans]|eukprot:XP_008867112.1 hypothetical protein, variant [Aphanomyces invadans]
MLPSQLRHAIEADEVDVPLHLLEDLGIEFDFEMDTESMSRAYFECAAEGNVETLRFLLSSDVKGELLNSVDVDGFSALMIAAAEGNRDVVLELLRRNADANLRTFELRSAALHFAAKNGDPDIVEEMCKHTTQIDFWNINADTPLVWACIEGRDAAVAVLLRHGADPRVTNHYGATTLMCATMIGEESDEATDAARKAIVTMLLERCPELVNVQDRDGSTAMHLAASCGYLQCCHALLAGGADITIRNAVGQTPLEEAEQTGCEGSEPCVAFLKVHWAKLEEEVNKRMRTMLELEDDPSLGVATPGKSTKKKKKQKKNSAAKKKQQLANKPATPPPNAFNTHSLPATAATRDIDDDDDSDASDEQVKLGSQTNRTVQASTTGLQAVQVPQPAVEEDAWTTVCRKQSHEKKDAGKHQPVTPHGVGLEQSDATHIASEVHSMKPASTAPQTHTQPTFPPIAQRLMREVDEEIAPTHRVTPESLVVPPVLVAAPEAASPKSPSRVRRFQVSTPDSPPSNHFHHKDVVSTPRYTIGSSTSIPFLHHRPTSLTMAPMTMSPPTSAATAPSMLYSGGSNRTVWSDRTYRKGSVPFRPTDKLAWLHQLDQNVRDALVMLACGTCGDWIHDNLQCPACQQLYCHRCVPVA